MKYRKPKHQKKRRRTKKRKSRSKKQKAERILRIKEVMRSLPMYVRLYIDIAMYIDSET